MQAFMVFPCIDFEVLVLRQLVPEQQPYHSGIHSEY